jgi:hypothetical protein
MLATCGATFGAGMAVVTAVNFAAGTTLATCCTGRALVRAFCGTATTAFGAVRFM